MLDTLSDIGPIRSTLELMDDPVMVTTADLDPPGPRIVFVNNAFTRITGYAPEEIVGETPRFLQSSKTNKEYVAKLRHDLRTKRSFVGETINQRKDGLEFAVECQIIPLFDDSGAVSYWLNIQRDAEAQKAAELGRRIAEEQLKESEHRIRTIMDSMPSRISYVDEKKRYQFTNKYYEYYYSFSENSCLNKHIKDVVGENIYEFAKPYIEKALSGEKVRFDYVDERGGTEYYWDATYVPDFDETGDVKGFFVLANDVTERKQAENALKQSVRQQTAILNNIPDIAWLKDCESRFIAVNEPFGKACGITPKRLVGKTDLEVWPEDLAYAYRADDQEVMRIRKSKRIEERVIDNRGNERWVETIKTPIITDRREVIGTTGIARDITQRKRIEAALRESEQRFQDYASSASDWFWEMGPDLKFTRFSEQLEAVTGLSPTRLIGKTREEFAGQVACGQKWNKHLEDLQYHRPFKNFEYKFTSDRGEDFYVRVSGVPVFDDNGAFQGYRGDRNQYHRPSARRAGRATRKCTPP